MTPLARVEADRAGADCIVRVDGEIDLSNSDDVTAAIHSAVDSGAARVIIDLSGVTYLDSVGVRLFLVLADRLRSRRQELRLRVPAGSPIHSTIDVAGLHGAVPVDLA